MNTKRRDYKDSQLFGWDAEPSEERPSEFAHSTGYSLLSGYHVLHDSPSAAGRRSKTKGLGFLLVVSALIVGLGAVGLYWLAQFLRA
jgi:hypothetical protein